MLKKIKILCIMTIIGFLPPILSAVTVQSGFDEDAVTYGGLRLREFRPNNNSGEVYLGTDLGSGSGRVENDWVYNDEWGIGDQQVNSFEFSYDKEVGRIYSKVTTGSGSPRDYNLSYDIQPAKPFNYIKMTIAGRTSGTSVSVTDLTLTTSEDNEFLGDYQNITGWNDWSIYEDLDRNFTLSGNLILNGPSSNQENNKVQFSVGAVSGTNPVPEPASLLFISIGGLLLRKFRV